MLLSVKVQTWLGEEPGVTLEGPGVTLEGPGVTLEGPGVTLEGQEGGCISLP